MDGSRRFVCTRGAVPSPCRVHCLLASRDCCSRTWDGSEGPRVSALPYSACLKDVPEVGWRPASVPGSGDLEKVVGVRSVAL
ncbi:hypothetical protein NDU88_007711 [Pleurodeles waltl]|uniref:Uncharacterized protein n=1 Tax=Pleurodeles waltl TaxID=8319 RepID=A0AAV7N6N6_PLEWA|nr:hypothetical protein NDU88_007711 [Pleurodeles waltl]